MIACYHLSIDGARPGAPLFDEASFEIPTGSWAEIVGPPGSGKTALFEMMSLRRAPRAGTFLVAGRDISRLHRSQLCALRRRIGSASSRPLFLEERTVAENLCVPLWARGRAQRAAELVEEALTALGLKALGGVTIGQLASDERRAVAIARATLGSDIILIDGGLAGIEGALARRARALLERALAEGPRTVVLFHRACSGPSRGPWLEIALEEARASVIERATHAPAPERDGAKVYR